ncbi:MAG: formate dehydrogenase subunit alpha [Syntrophorhabdaceae bacterium]|nr:formate dehydrogenase subunit alpha [Syntrophorhabdaceae bacterium]
MEITVNGKVCEGDEGQTILDVARANGFKIPTLCHLAGLAPTGACRICVVEVEGQRNLLAACSTPVIRGMVVRTDSVRVLNARRFIVELLVSCHPLDCMTCEKMGNCDLQDLAYELKVTSPRTEGERYDHPIDFSNPFIVRDYNKCILCLRCVRVCKEFQGIEAIKTINRGFDTKIATAYDTPLQDSNCVFCGQCVQVCPVGALTEKKAIGLGRTYETKQVRTTCPYCGVGCQLNLHVKGERIVRVTGVEDGLPNQGRLCVKGRFGYDFIYSEDRLTTPLIREEDGQFREASWDEALDLVAGKFKEIIKKSGPDAVAGISCARSINEDSYNMQKLFRAVFQTNNIDHCARVCHAPTVAGLAASFGSGAGTNSIIEYKNAKMLFLIGTNMTEAHPVASYYVKEAISKGAKLIVADPRRHELAKRADIFAQIKVGSDVAFLNGIMNVLINENLYDRKFVEDHCTGFEELKKTVMDYPPEKAAEISGVPAETIVRIAREMAAIRPSMLIYTLGITEHSCGTNNVMSCANLQMLLGNMGVEFGGVNPLRGQNNVQGACDMGALPNVFPGYQSVAVPENREKFMKAWGVAGLPDKPGLVIPAMMEGLLTKKIRALWVFGENLANAEPNITHAEKCLGSAEFLVVQDIFPNETTRFANVILPSASWCEDEGTFTSLERRVSMVRTIKGPPGVARPNWWIFKETARKMGHDWASNSGREICDNELAVLCPMFAGIRFSRIEKDGLQWPCPNEDHPGTTIVHRDGQFTHGKGILKGIEWTPPEEVPDGDYPFVLSTGRRLSQYHTRTQTGRSGMDFIYSRETADISIDDAKEKGISDGDMVVVESRRGKVTVPARVTDTIPRGMVWMTFHYRDGNCNWLTNNAYDVVTKTPEYKACAVNVQKA